MTRAHRSRARVAEAQRRVDLALARAADERGGVGGARLRRVRERPRRLRERADLRTLSEALDERAADLAAAKARLDEERAELDEERAEFAERKQATADALALLRLMCVPEPAPRASRQLATAARASPRATRSRYSSPPSYSKTSLQKQMARG